MGSDRVSEIIERNKHYLVKSTYGSWTFNNKQSANTLNKVLTEYESTTAQIEYLNAENTKYQKVISRIQKQLTSTQMTVSILSSELEKLQKETEQ